MMEALRETADNSCLLFVVQSCLRKKSYRAHLVYSMKHEPARRYIDSGHVVIVGESPGNPRLRAR